MWVYRNRPTEKARPIVLFGWQPRVKPIIRRDFLKNSTIGKASAYSIHQKFYLRTFLNDGDVPMDNNYAKQAIRPFTIGCKNFVLIETSNGARASAMIYSIVETAKANYLNVYQYFELLLTEILKNMNDTDLKFINELLP